MPKCLQPFLVDGSIPVPCGKCPPCLKRRASAWSFRLMQEDKICNSSQFITLTYDTDHVPLTEKGYMDLCKRDLQLYFKRLRKLQSNSLRDGVYSKPIKYYAVGEYGGRTFRPHYHIILFNCSIELIQEAWKLDGKYLGTVHYGTVSGASVGYCLKYMTKPGRIPLHQNDDRQPEFSLMSKGLGEVT